MRLAFTALLLLPSVNLNAQQIISTEKTYDETLRGQRFAPLTDQLFGDQVNNKDGSLHFSQTDVVVPTNSGLKVEFTRRTPRQKQGVDAAQLPLGSGWEIDIPYMMGTYDTRRGWDALGGTGRCSSSMLGPTQWVGPSPNYNTRVMPAHLYWSGIHINIPGAGDQNLLRLLPGQATPQDGQTYIGAASGFWRIGCLPTIKNGSGEGFLVRLTDGTKYYFDWMATRNAFDALESEFQRDINGEGTNPTGLLVPTSDVFLYATKVEDRHGNSVMYNYDAINKHRLTSIVASDGARIDIAYNSTGKVYEVRALGQVWRYTYEGTTRPYLKEVLLPDQTKWTFAGGEMWWYAVPPKLPSSFYTNSCAQNATGYRSQDPATNLPTWVITHPSGAQGTFVVRQLIHGSDNTPGGCDIFGTSSSNFWFGSYGVPNAYLAMSLVSKKISGPGLVDQTWTFSYAPNWSFAKNCAAGCTSTTRVTDPDGDITEQTYGNSYTDNQNLLLKEQLTRGGLVQRTTTYAYESQSAAYPQNYGQILDGTNGPIGLYGNPNATRIRPLQSKVITQSGQIYSTTVEQFDAFARPVRVKKENRSASSP